MPAPYRPWRPWRWQELFRRKKIPTSPPASGTTSTRISHGCRRYTCSRRAKRRKLARPPRPPADGEVATAAHVQSVNNKKTCKDQAPQLPDMPLLRPHRMRAATNCRGWVALQMVHSAGKGQDRHCHAVGAACPSGRRHTTNSARRQRRPLGPICPRLHTQGAVDIHTAQGEERS